MKLHYVQPGKPNRNVFIERLNKTNRTEVLAVYLFWNLGEVREATSWEEIA